jgi:light-regulated signal transduction histidine kinase (bacteriophytochrome)
MTAPLLLIVDDDAAERALVARLARQSFPDAAIETASGPAEAREACGRQAFDCIILDYNMPGMDGLAFAQSLRASFPYLPIVMSTGYGDEMLAAHAVTSGVTDYVPKAKITAQSLLRVVENAIRITSQVRVIDEQRSELENFAFALAHDFKQPIRQIMTFTGLISEAIRADRGQEIAGHLTFLNDAARRLGNLVDVMSQYTLLSQPPALGPVDLGKVIADLRVSLAPYIEERGGRLSCDALPQVRGNEALVGQVLQNLVVNGLKYNKSAVPAVHIACEQAAGHCLLRVRDNGIGVEPQYAEQIFKPLVRLHTKAEYPGTGLGLTLARKALTAMEGGIACQPQPAGGTEFTVKLMLAAA